MKRTIRFVAACLAVTIATTAGSLALVPAASANVADSTACSDVEAVFARGSGEKLESNAANQFAAKLQKRLQPTLSVHTFELGHDPASRFRYPAVPINGDFGSDPIGTVGAWVTAKDAFFSAGYANTYGLSVDFGVAELTEYLRTREAVCPASYFVLGGFSQGAQTVGQAYNYSFDDGLRKRVIFNALFGDPKLYLPEGAWQPFGPPSACSGERSEYRRGQTTPDNCVAWWGSLQARKPYLPASWTDKTGLWCNGHDFVCGSSYTLSDNSGHEYAGTPMDEAVNEVADRLKKEDPRAADLQTDVRIIKPGTTGLDVVFLIDSTGSMGDKIAQARQFVSTMSDRIHAMNGRVALVEYKDSGDAVPAKILSGLNPDTADLQAKLADVGAFGGDDTPEGLLHGLKTAFDGLAWKQGATKAAVVLTDATFHDPDLTDGSTLASIAKRSLEIDPVNIYPVVPSYLTSDYSPLAEATSGKVITDEGDSAAALSTALTRIEQRPVALLAMDEYSAAVGGTMTFDASSSYAMAGSIASYEWDANGDGTFEEKTTTPVYKHTYPAAFEGVMQVRVTDTLGGVSSASAKVHVTPPAPNTVPGPPTAVTAAANPAVTSGSEVKVTWKSDVPAPKAWALKVNGVLVGGVSGTERSATITDVQRDKDVEFEVVGVTAAGEFGVPAAAVLPASPGTAPVTPPVTPPKPADPAPVASATPAPTAPSTPGAVIAPVAQAPAAGAPAALAQTIQQAAVDGQAPAPSPSSTTTPAQAQSSSPAPTDSPSTAPVAAAPPNTSPSTPEADIGPWPWLLGGIVLLGVAAVSLVYRRRNIA